MVFEQVPALISAIVEHASSAEVIRLQARREVRAFLEGVKKTEQVAPPIVPGHRSGLKDRATDHGPLATTSRSPYR